MKHPIAPQYDDAPLPPGQARLTNMQIAFEAMRDCAAASDTMPRLGVFYGPAGYGKSVGAAFAAARFGAAYVTAMSIWTQRSFLDALAHALGIARPLKTGPQILGQIIDLLRAHPRPVIVDEMDYLVKKQMVDIIRDIHDNSPAPILMIGMEALPAKLRDWEQFDSRVLVHAAAQPASEADALKLRDAYAGEVRIADDLALAFHAACAGVTRRIVVNLERAEIIGGDEGLDELDLAAWGERHIETGTIAPRRTWARDRA